MIVASDITGLVLAGGRATRMGGVDKGLQLFHGVPLAQNALQRLQAQVGSVAVNANRHLNIYAEFTADVWPDATFDYAGPLAGFLSGLERCTTPWLLTVPCDSPRFPLDLATRLAAAAEHAGADIAVPLAADGSADGNPALRWQPVFCLISQRLRTRLAQYLQTGGRKAEVWIREQQYVAVPFDHAGDDPNAFANANSLAELNALQGAQDV